MATPESVVVRMDLSKMAEASSQHATSAEHVRRLHRLSAARYESLDQAFDDHLQAGCDLLGLPAGAILELKGSTYIVRAAEGSPGVSVGCEVALEDSAGHISAPISAGSERYGVLCFSDPRACAPRDFSATDQEIVELLAHGLGRVVLERQARRDDLTGLPNRSLFVELTDAALQEAGERGEAAAVLFIDLDRFQQMNESLGHAIGDRLIQQVAQRLEALVREGDRVGRVGGDEFAVVLARQPDEASAAGACQAMLPELQKPYQVEGRELFLTASIGMAMFPQHGASAAELLHKADVAVHRVKTGGRNAVQVFSPDGDIARLERLRLENALRRALENREFEVLYQPVVDMRGQVTGFEALLAWQHPEYGTIAPGQFIPIAEEAGLIVEIGGWVLQQACLEAASWQKTAHRAVRVSVNVSALQLERSDFVETVAAALAISGLAPQGLETRVD